MTNQLETTYAIDHREISEEKLVARKVERLRFHLVNIRDESREKCRWRCMRRNRFAFRPTPLSLLQQVARRSRPHKLWFDEKSFGGASGMGASTKALFSLSRWLCFVNWVGVNLPGRASLLRATPLKLRRS